MSLRALFSVLTLAVLLPACASTGDRHAAAIPAGTIITLERQLILPSDNARVFVQYGERVSGSAINRYSPLCSFGLRRSGDEPLARSIKPATFDAGEPRTWKRRADGAGGGVLMASAGTHFAGLGASQRERTHSRWDYHTEVRLYAPGQPQVYDMRCTYNGTLYEGHLTLEEIRETLAGVATIRLPDGT